MDRRQEYTGLWGMPVVGVKKNRVLQKKLIILAARLLGEGMVRKQCLPLLACLEEILVLVLTRKTMLVLSQCQSI